MKIRMTTPRPPARSDLRPVEALILDVLARGPDEANVEPGVFLGLPPAVLSEGLGNLMALGFVASAEGITPTAPQPIVWSKDIQTMGRVRQMQDRLPPAIGVGVSRGT